MPDRDRPAISNGCSVCIVYRLVLEDGSVFEDSGPDGLRLRIGEQSLPAGLESALIGMREGDTGSFEFDPDELWGVHDAGRVQRLPLSDFPDDAPPEIGQVIDFALPDGRSVAGTIRARTDTDVEVDFNHPLHDRGVRVDVRIVAIDPESTATPTPEPGS